MLAINFVLFASLITAHKAVVENPEQTVDIHKPSNTPVPERVKLIPPAGSLGNQHLVLVRQKAAGVSNIWQRPPLELHPQQQQLKDLLQPPHVTVHSVQTSASTKCPTADLGCQRGICSDTWLHTSL